MFATIFVALSHFVAGQPGRFRRGGENWAVIATLVETFRLNGADPYAYLADVLARIVNGHPNDAIDDLLPWAYSTPTPLKAAA